MKLLVALQLLHAKDLSVVIVLALKQWCPLLDDELFINVVAVVVCYPFVKFSAVVR